jgi:hypothetical protein
MMDSIILRKYGPTIPYSEVPHQTFQFREICMMFLKNAWILCSPYDTIMLFNLATDVRGCVHRDRSVHCDMFVSNDSLGTVFVRLFIIFFLELHWLAAVACRAVSDQCIFSNLLMTYYQQSNPCNIGIVFGIFHCIHWYLVLTPPMINHHFMF